MRKKRTWLLLVAVALGVGLGILGYSLFMHSGSEYITVSELTSQGESLRDKYIRVEGRVTPGSVKWDKAAKTMRFVLTDNKDSLNVVYEGVVPDSFKPEAEMIVEGKYRANDVFEARSFGSRRSICNICH